MFKRSLSEIFTFCKPVFKYIFSFLLMFSAFFLVEVVIFLLLKPADITGLNFGLLWAGMLAGIILCLPRLAGRITFGILYFVMLLWGLAQVGYYQVFGKMMWLSTIGYAGEGAAFLGDVISYFPFFWWIFLICMIALGVLILWKYPNLPKKRWIAKCVYLVLSIGFLFGLTQYPKAIFEQDKEIWGTGTEYAQSSSYRAAYKTMFDAKRVYDFTGIYQLTMRDIWVNELYPLTPSYKATLTEQRKTIDAYFAKRDDSAENEMTGIFEGKNVIMVLMESMDDWMITKEDTPTIQRLMNEGINFTNFYTPGFGSARTLNSEFCMNTGIYLPTTGNYVFDYVTNSYKQSIASQMTANGYSSLVFHYNDPDFYSRGVFEPAMGYERYVCYADYAEGADADEISKILRNEEYLFDQEDICNLFFRDGQTFNAIITRSAHLSYKYNEELSRYALRLLPRYRGLYGSEEEDCARVKARLVDNMFSRLLRELNKRGELENTVIIAMTDHYTYGYKNMEELYAHSGVNCDLLLEKTPCFVWSADCTPTEVTKTLNTSDFLPTMLNLLGIDSPYSYLGKDAFDPNYPGYALFPDGSWISDGVAWQNNNILLNEKNRLVTKEEIAEMANLSEEYRMISNLLLTCDYYR